MARSPQRFGLNPATALFASAMISAGLIAVLTQRGSLDVKSATPSDLHESAEPHSLHERGQPSPASAHEGESSLSEMEVLELKRRWAEAQKEIEEIEVPTMEQARKMQLPAQEARVDIVRDGVEALVPHLSCSLPAVLVDEARSGPGVLGCVLESSGGRPSIVGRAAHRRGGGNFEVGDYQEGRRQGNWEEYYPTGILAARGEYEGGQRTGAWDEFDEEGVHRVRRHYLAGQKYGAAIHYFQAEPTIEVWSSVGRVDPETKRPLDERLAAAP